MPFNVLIISLAAILLLAITLATLLLNRKLRRIRTLLRRQERLVWDSQNLFRVLGGEAPLPLPGGWAASTDILGELLRALTAQRPQLVVELGSGLSTLIIAAALKRNGAGRLISIDADADYAQQTRAQLALHGLDPWVQVRVAPLREISFEGVSRRGSIPRRWRICRASTCCSSTDRRRSCGGTFVIPRYLLLAALERRCMAAAR